MNTQTDYQQIISVLCQEPRPTGSRRNRQVSEYIISNLSKQGYDVQVQDHPFVGWELYEEPKVRFIEPKQKEVRTIPVVWSSPIEKSEVLGELKRVRGIKTFEAYPWLRFALIGSESQILAYLITREDFVWAQPLNNPNGKIPYIIIDEEACGEILQWQKGRHHIMASASLNCKKVPGLTMNNIIATPSNEDCSIIIAAHYDSMYNTVGAHDNASGIAAFLSVATTKPKGVKFIAFDAEEWNKFGAYTYVKKANRTGELQHTKLMINIDSVGVGSFIYVLVSPEIEHEVRRAINNTVISKEIKIGITARDRFPQFDSWPFMRYGVPVIQIGTQGESRYEYFHDAKDVPDEIDIDLINKSARFVSELAGSLRI